jgi:hypothetical protein
MVLCYPQNQLLNHHPSQKQAHNTMNMPLANAVCTTPSKAMILNPYSNGKGTILKRGASIDIFCRLVALRRTIASKWVIKVLTHVHGQNLLSLFAGRNSGGTMRKSFSHNAVSNKPSSSLLSHPCSENSYPFFPQQVKFLCTRVHNLTILILSAWDFKFASSFSKLTISKPPYI